MGAGGGRDQFVTIGEAVPYPDTYFDFPVR